MHPPETEDWLAEFLPRLRLAGRRVVDLGCGPGLDAAYLADRAFDVVALDRERPGWGAASGNVAFLRGDLCSLPFRGESFDAVIASLSLHYLPWAETVAAFAAACRLARPGGAFLFRVNASDDFAHGAGSGEEIEPGYRAVGKSSRWSQSKRFFDEEMVRAALPAHATIEVLEHRTIHRYQEPKRVWLCLALVTRGRAPV